MMLQTHTPLSPTILLIDADNTLRGLLSQFLSSHGFSVCNVGNTQRMTPAITPPPGFSIGDCQFDPKSEALYFPDNKISKLTNTESRLLQFFCRNAGQVLTRDAISIHLYGMEAHPLDRRIDMQVRRLRSKLEPNTKAEDASYLRTVWRQGYRLTP